MIALYCAFFVNWSRYLSAGERAVISIVAADKAQAKVIFDYLVGMLRSIPVFAKKLIRETLGELELAGGLSITINAGNYRTIRGRTIVVFLADEICFWRDAETSASPADEVLAAVRPAQATVPGALTAPARLIRSLAQRGKRRSVTTARTAAELLSGKTRLPG